MFEKKILLKLYHHYQKYLESKYTLLLFSIIFMLMVSPHLDISPIYTFFNTILFIFILFATIFAAHRKKKLVFELFIFGIIYFILRFLYFTTHIKLSLAFSKIIFAVFILTVVISFTKDIFSKKIVTRDLIVGSICVYMLIGIMFGLLYDSFNSIFHHSVRHIQGEPFSEFDFYYFSFVTLTTVGFGDIIVISPALKPFVMIESVTGVFYIAVMVARLVALM